jgi:hypothetical protein
MDLRNRVTIAVQTALLLVGLTGCNDISWDIAIEPRYPGGILSGEDGVECFVERFQQPSAPITQSLDLLFIADTSGSMADNRVAVADGLHALVGQLPGTVDYRIGMLLAHSSASPHSGRLWTLDGADRNPVTGFPYVLDSAQMDQATIQSRLRTMMQLAPEAGGQGEMGMFSLLRALSPAGVAEAQGHGFFRANAALAIVFISDENDICAVYPASPAAATGLTALEQQIRSIDCADGISATSVIDAVKGLQGTQPFLFGAIVNDDINVNFGLANDGYGWGYMDIVQQGQGVAVNIAASDYTAGLAQFGSLAHQSLELKLSLELQRSPVDASTIEVVVDGAVKGHVFEPATHTVHFLDAGVASSQIEVTYCLSSQSGGGNPVGI